MSKIVSSFTSDTRFNDVLVHRFVINIMVETNTFYTHTQSHTHSTNELNYNNVRLIECPLQHTVCPIHLTEAHTITVRQSS